jgi:hypothetical protein
MINSAWLVFLFTAATLFGKDTEDGQQKKAAGNNVKIGLMPYAKKVISQYEGDGSQQHQDGGKNTADPGDDGVKLHNKQVFKG